MNPERWDRLQRLFYEASGMEAQGRKAFLEAECPTDPALRMQVESLILSSTETAVTGVMESLQFLAASAISVTAGERIGNYEVVRELGHGGMGSVFLAVRADDQFRKQVAIKLMNVAIAGPEMLARFRSERQILADLDHPNIARMLDGGATSSGLPYVVMEYIDGSPIDEYCRDHGLGVAERLGLFRQLCDAVMYAHRNLIVHRDLKPANVLVGADGSPKLLDFGIAKLVRDDGAPRTVALTSIALTQVSERLMTPEYASPEQARGESITTASDIYSLGVLLYELLAGRRPFEIAGRTAVEIQKTICDSEPRRPSTHGPRELRGDLDNIVLMAMRKEPQRRYASVDQFSEDIRRYLEGFPVIAREDTWGYRTGKFVRRHRWSVTAAALFLLLLIAFGAAMALLAKRVAAERDIANTEKRNAEQVSQFLVDSFRLADRSGTQGRTLTAQEVLDRGSDRIFKQLADQPVVRAKMMNTMGEVYESLGLYDRAQVLLNNALQTHATVESLSSLGQLADTKGEFGVAEAWYRKALAAEEKTSGPGSAETAAIEAKLGSALGESAQGAEAERLLRESLAVRRKLFGNNSAPVADSLGRLGRLKNAQQKYAEAEPLYREALAIRRRTLGPEDPETVNAIGDLAFVLNTRGNLNEAEKLQRESLALHRKLYGESHILVAENLAALGILRFNAGDYTEAVSLDRQAADIFRTALGPASPQLADAVIEMGNSLERMGRLQEAEARIREGLAMITGLLGEHHPETASAQHNLVNILHDEGKNAEAERLMTGIVAWQRNADAQSPALAFNLAALGGLKRSRGDFAAADRDYQEALIIFRKAFGERHSTYGRALTSLANNRISMGQLKEPEADLRKAIDIIRHADQANPLDLSFPLVALAQDLLLQKRAAEAEAPAREAVALRRKLGAAGDLRLALAESVLGGCLAALGRSQEAEPLLVESHRNLLKLANDRSAAPELRRLGDFNRSSGR
jgi:serine/threonine-protein kinase